MSPPTIFRTLIKHVRTEPQRHSFAYKSAIWYVDVDDLPRIPGLVCFRADDHLRPPGVTLRERVEAVLTENEIRATGRITALMIPRSFGHVFNPLSIFWCHDATDKVTHTLLEVHNMYGDRHCYVADSDENEKKLIAKRFRVSPFNDVSGYYSVHVPEPDRSLRIRITLHNEQRDFFTATMVGVNISDAPSNVMRSIICNPALATSIRIRKRGLALWLRGLPLREPENSERLRETSSS